MPRHGTTCRLFGAAFALAVTATACTPMHWVSVETGATVGADDALAECRTLARTEEWRTRAMAGWPPVYCDAIGRCVGARDPFGSGPGRSEERVWRLVDFCMRAKGFELVPEDGG